MAMSLIKKDVHNAFARLDAAGLSIRGLMTWSIDWDNGKDVQGKSYNWEFKTRYASLGNNDDGSSNNNLPLAPTTLFKPQRRRTALNYLGSIRLMSILSAITPFSVMAIK